MESIKEIYKVGYGPSSSHTIGPRKASEDFLKKNPKAFSYKVTLYGSLALTGKGHLTDKAIEDVFAGKAIEITWEPTIVKEFHTNALLFECFEESGKLLDNALAYSVGGGRIVYDKDKHKKIEASESLYPYKTMAGVLDWSLKTGRSYWEYVFEVEDDDFPAFLGEIWDTMKSAISNGLENEGALPGPLGLRRKASSYYVKSKTMAKHLQNTTHLFAYALAVSEENASGGKVVTAPTCGSAGILPAVLKFMQESFGFSDQRIIRALATAGLIGNLIKENASISGAEVGCQGEVGTACAMASAAAAQLTGGGPKQIEYAAEIGLEHHLGLTCDPVGGLVQIPCIERNAHGAVRAVDAASFAIISDGEHYVSFDETVEAMKQTGDDLPSLYKETALGGLAKFAKKPY
ncbi:MAG: L-serine ammonia-lyase [Bacteroidetes bacterium 4572_77]|nr:MAG: L-serine ammonia-lyase [Bacteroidetes bacterium 4572_77]